MSQPQQPYNQYQENPPPYFEDAKAAPAQPQAQQQWGAASAQNAHPTWGGAHPPPPPQGWTPYPVSYGTVIIDQQPQGVPITQVILVGGCPSCRVGVLEDSFSCLGLLCAILFFPIGILCCLVMREKRCTNCGASF